VTSKGPTFPLQTPARPHDHPPTFGEQFSRWFYEGHSPESAAKPAHTDTWWKVMCLTGVDYFSTLAYQPSIAFVAAGALSPLATFVLVALTLLGAFPMYSRVADLSPYGQGSILILEKLFPKWKGKAVVLCLLGFAATGFVITITLSAADATAHLIQNPLSPAWLNHPIAVTIVLLLVLAAIFMKGFGEAIALAVAIVVAYMTLNGIVIAAALREIWRHAEVLANWKAMLVTEHGHPVVMVAMALLLFPKLALGLSGFETGVAVMPLVRGDPADTEDAPRGRIRNTKKLLLTAALIMSVMLMASSFVTVLLIPADAFKPGNAADGRALAYLAHYLLGSGFGTLYDLATIVILWFAGSSAMAGLLTLVPKYLPRYGMAPEWARATRPLVAIITGIAVIISIAFQASVGAQGGAYATGVLVLMSSGALAIAIVTWRHRRGWLPYLVITGVFLYTLVTNMFEQPEGLKIASVFIVTIVVMSLISRTLRSTELRVHGFEPDETALKYIWDAARRGGAIRIIANRPGSGLPAEYEDKLREASDSHHVPAAEPVLFLEVQPGDASEFSDVLKLRGVEIGGHRVLRSRSPAIPNAIAALLIYIRDQTGQIPHVYFGWTEGNPITYLLKFLAFGEGDTAPVCREVLRQFEPDPQRRPRVHVG
jgi:hypothetical protein